MPPKRKLSQPEPDAPGAVATEAEVAAPSGLVLADDAAFAAGLEALARLDAGFMEVMRQAGELPRLRRRDPGFAGLAAIIVSQQVSTASANAIFGRVQARYPDLCATHVLAASDDDLRSCGLSAPKIRTLRAIAEVVACGELDFDWLATAEAEVAHARLCEIKGVGPWTADIFLLFCLGHADAWPAGDLALQEGARTALGLATRPDTKALHSLGERWRPLRGVVAHCLWAFYGHTRGRPATLEATAPDTEASLKKTPARKSKAPASVPSDRPPPKPSARPRRTLAPSTKAASARLPLNRSNG